MSERRQILINIISNIVSFAVGMGISFFLTPYIVNNVGSEAYGFVSLGNQFIGYIQIIVVALNSMAARFITIQIYEKNMLKAEKYFSSVFFSNILITLILIIPISVFVFFLEKFINIPIEMIFDVKILWTIIFANFFISIITNVFSISTYAKNRLELTALRQIEANILKAILLIVLYVLCRPSIIYIGIGAFVTTIYLMVWNIFYTKKFLGEMKISWKNISLKSIKELISSGIWNSLTQLSTTLLAGLDLLIANLFVGVTAMGQLSIAKTLPTVINQFLSTVPGAFSPQFTIAYAEKNYDKLLKDINSAIKIMSVISSVPLVGLAVFGKAFFQLWVPTQDAQLLHLLALLTVSTTFITAPIKPLYTVYTVTNKVKMESISIFIQGIVSTIIVFVVLYIFKDETSENIKLYVIAGVSTTLGIIRSLTFTPIYAAYCLNVKKSTFYKSITVSVVAFLLSYVIEKMIFNIFPVYSWSGLIGVGVMASAAGLVCNMFIILEKRERKWILNKIFKRRC